MPFQGSSGGSKVVPFYGSGMCANPANVILAQVAPSTNNTESPIGTIYVNTATSTLYICVANTGPAGSVTWEQIGLSTGTVATLTGGSGGAIAPSAGNINLIGTANQITTTGSGSTITWSLPSAITAPGSLITTTTNNATTSMTAGTTITATLGNITATNGNFVASAAGSGIVVPAAIIPAGASPLTSNARAGACIFSGVSIAAAADQTFVISNSTITGATTVVMLSMSGATTGSALSIKSVVNSASTCTIVVTNGTGATTSTANIQFAYVVLN